MDPEYDLWYALLNCGIRLPASTGSDWFVCSSNRVYVSLGASGEAFSYANWLASAGQRGTNIHYQRAGPEVGRGADMHRATTCWTSARACGRSQVTVEWAWHQALDTIEIVRDGEVAATRTCAPDETRGVWTTTLDATGGWLAARAWGGGGTATAMRLGTHQSGVSAPARGARVVRAFRQLSRHR